MFDARSREQAYCSDECQRKAHVARRKRRRRIEAKIDGTGERRIGVKLPEDLFVKLAEEAELEGVSVSRYVADIVRDAIRDRLQV